MPLGPGKYDEECTWVRQKTGAAAAIVIVIEGNRGGGFSVQSAAYLPPKALAKILRDMADQMDTVQS